MPNKTHHQSQFEKGKDHLQDDLIAAFKPLIKELLAVEENHYYDRFTSFEKRIDKITMEIVAENKDKMKRLKNGITLLKEKFG